MKRFSKFLFFASLLALFFTACNDDDMNTPVGEQPTASFTFQIDTDNTAKVNFTNTSQNGLEYTWDFGDGTTSTEENPSHTYNGDAVYTVRLTAFNFDKSDVATQDVSIGTPMAAFTFEVDATDPLLVRFTNTSQNTSTYSWDFGDGTTSTEESPEHTYADDGMYTVTLSSTEGNVTDMFSEEITLFVCADDEPQSLDPASAFNISFQEEVMASFQDNLAFERIANPDVVQDGVNPSCNVGQITKGNTVSFDNLQFDLSSKFDFTTNTGFKMKVWSPAAGKTILLKLEDLADPAINAETSATTTVAQGWEELEFFFGADQSNKFDKMVLFFGFLEQNADVYYFDDLKHDVATAPTPIELPLTFEEADLMFTFENFGGAVTSVVDNPDMTDNPSTKVAQLLKTAGSETWAGSFITLDNPIPFSATANMLKLKVWSPKEGAVIKVKVENSGDPNINFEQDMATTTSNAWEEITYNFSGINLGQEYDRVVLFYDFGVGGADEICYFDDVVLAEGGGGAGLTLPIDFEGDAALYSFVDFGGAVSVLNANPDMTGINTSANVGKLTKTGGSETWAGSFLTLPNPIEFSATNNKLRMKVWSPKSGAVVKLKVENNADGNIAAEVDVNTTTSDMWEELTFDFSGIDLSQEYHKVVVFMDFGIVGDDSEYYFDDIELIP